MFLFVGKVSFDRLKPDIVVLFDSEIILAAWENRKAFLTVGRDQTAVSQLHLAVVAGRQARGPSSFLLLVGIDLPPVGIEFEPHALLPGHVIRLVAHFAPSLFDYW